MSAYNFPWFFHVEHLAAGGDVNLIIGDGAFDSVAGCSIVTEAGERWISGGGDVGASVGVPVGRKFVVGFRHKTPASSFRRVLQLYSSTTRQMSLQVNSGALSVARGAITTLSPGSFPIADDVPRYIEFACDVAAAGSFEVRVDGVPIGGLTASGVDTEEVAADITRIALQGSDRFGHIYIKDWDGPSDPGFLGPINMQLLRPSSDVATAWTRSGGTTNSENVDDTAPDGNATYVETSDLGDVDEYELVDTVGVDAVLAVVPFAVGIAPSGGAPLVDLALKVGGVEDYATLGRALSAAGYRGVWGEAHTLQPGGGAWTPSVVDSARLLIRSA